mgnify:CR=1 FL=1
MKKSYEIDMCNGPLLGKILLFSIPLMLSGILTLVLSRCIRESLEAALWIPVTIYLQASRLCR